MNAAEISIESLVKKFEGVTAVDGLSLSIGKGELFGLLGPNGAGKSTTINVLCGILPPTDGRIRIGENEIPEDTERIKEITGVCPQEYAIYPYLTGRENVEFFGSLHAMPKDLLKKNTDALLEKMSLTEDADRKTKEYSGGMKRRISLISALVNDPGIAILDEPTTGMDPAARRTVWEFIKSLRSRGTTVILTTHYMEEAEFICDRVGIIDHGRLIALGTPDELKSKYAAKNLEDVFLQLTGRNIREGA